MARNVFPPHSLSAKPDEAWKKIKRDNSIVTETLVPFPLNKPISEDSVRFVCLSDTHSRKQIYHGIIPPGDVLLHAGDFTEAGNLYEIKEFNAFLGSLPHTYKVVVAGNHELTFDPRTRSKLFSEESVDAQQLLSNCIYLEDKSVVIYGISIYGTPWQPEHNDWAFNLKRGQPCVDKWNQIPSGIDILLTHTPPVGFGDRISTGMHVGCVDLLCSIQQRIKPKYHVFGHIHEDYGITTDGVTVFINCSICNIRYNPVNDPIIFDIKLPENVKKDGGKKEKAVKLDGGKKEKEKAVKI